MEEHDASAASALVGHQTGEQRGMAAMRSDGGHQCSSLPRSLKSLVNVVRRPATAEQVAGLLTSTAQELGFDRFSYLSLACPGHQYGRPLLRYISNQPDEWTALYKRERLQRNDPVVCIAEATRRAFVWDLADLMSSVTPQQERVCAFFQRFGLCRGITAPVHGSDADLTILTVSCRETRPDLDRLLPEVGSMLLLLAICIGSWIETSANRHAQQHPALSEREKECLLWTARGKTSWETAKIIGRSEDTVNFHLKKAITKLNASNKCHAVSKAITQGQLLI